MQYGPRGYIDYSRTPDQPGRYPGRYQWPVDPYSLDLGPALAGQGQPIPNLNYNDTHDVAPGAPNPYDFLGPDIGGRVLRTGINPYITPVGDVMQFPWERRRKEIADFKRGWYVPITHPPTPVTRINPFFQPRRQ